MTRTPGSGSSDPQPLSARVAAWLLAGLLATTGTLHFLAPSGFESIVPGFLGHPAFWVRSSGVAELACAVAIAVRPSRRVGAIAAALLFVAVFPANVQMALDSGGRDHGLLHDPVVAWGRLPLQIPLVLWAGYVAHSGRAMRTRQEAKSASRPA